MADLTLQERLQPSLLDRLTDDNPRQQRESRDQRVLSIRRLRECVMRDLGWLLNTGNLASVQSLDECPQVVSSVLNYGLPDLSGITSSAIDVVELERVLREAIKDFEPRILRNSVRVQVFVDQEKMSVNTLTFDIQGELWAQPMPLQLFMRTSIDLETGDVNVTDRPG